MQVNLITFESNYMVCLLSIRLRPYKAGGWRVRSTTTISPYTLNAEIYEVHPASRQRITTTKTTTQKPSPLPALDFPSYDDDQYDQEVIEPVTERY